MNLCPRHRLLCRMRIIHVVSLDYVKRDAKEMWRNCSVHGKIEGVENHHIDGSICNCSDRREMQHGRRCEDNS